MRSDVTAIEIIREFSQLKLSSEIDSLGGVISPMASFDHLAMPRSVRGRVRSNFWQIIEASGL